MYEQASEALGAGAWLTPRAQGALPVSGGSGVSGQQGLRLLPAAQQNEIRVTQRNRLT